MARTSSWSASYRSARSTVSTHSTATARNAASVLGWNAVASLQPKARAPSLEPSDR